MHAMQFLNNEDTLFVYMYVGFHFSGSETTCVNILKGFHNLKRTTIRSKELKHGTYDCFGKDTRPKN